MIVALWRRRNRCRPTVRIETLRRRTARILRYRIMSCHLLGNGALRPAFRERRHLAHGRTGGTCRDRRLAVLVATAETDIGQPLE
jgi:hypothetical protein